MVNFASVLLLLPLVSYASAALANAAPLNHVDTTNINARHVENDAIVSVHPEEDALLAERGIGGFLKSILPQNKPEQGHSGGNAGESRWTPPTPNQDGIGRDQKLKDAQVMNKKPVPDP